MRNIWTLNYSSRTYRVVKHSITQAGTIYFSRLLRQKNHIGDTCTRKKPMFMLKTHSYFTIGNIDTFDWKHRTIHPEHTKRSNVQRHEHLQSHTRKFRTVNVLTIAVLYLHRFITRDVSSTNHPDETNYTLRKRELQHREILRIAVCTSSEHAAKKVTRRIRFEIRCGNECSRFLLLRWKLFADAMIR